MRRSCSKTGALATGLAMIVGVAFAGTADAAVRWQGNVPTDFVHYAEFQDRDMNYNSTNGSTITVAKDPTYGDVLRFHKDDDDRRAEVSEAKGVPIVNGDTYFLGWRFKISHTRDTYSLFQWKSGGNHQQNYPIVLKTEGGKVKLQHYKVGDLSADASTRLVPLFEAPFDADRWYNVAIKIKASSDASQGKVQFWWGPGGPENLATGGQEFTGRTYDGNKISPKWGVYGHDSGTTDLDMDALKIGTAIGDVFLG